MAFTSEFLWRYGSNKHGPKETVFYTILSSFPISILFYFLSYSFSRFFFLFVFVWLFAYCCVFKKYTPLLTVVQPFPFALLLVPLDVLQCERMRLVRFKSTEHSQQVPNTSYKIKQKTATPPKKWGKRTRKTVHLSVHYYYYYYFSSSSPHKQQSISCAEGTTFLSIFFFFPPLVSLLYT